MKLRTCLRVVCAPLLILGMACVVPGVSANENRKAVANPKPDYPSTARQLGLHGVAKIQVLIAANGHVIAAVPNLGATEATSAVEAASAAFSGWANKTCKERSAVLRRWYDLVVAAREDEAPSNCIPTNTAVVVGRPPHGCDHCATTERTQCRGP